MRSLRCIVVGAAIALLATKAGASLFFYPAQTATNPPMFINPFSLNQNATIAFQNVSEIGVGFIGGDDPDSPFYTFTSPFKMDLTFGSGAVIPGNVARVLVANASTLTITGNAIVGPALEFHDTTTGTMSGGSLGQDVSTFDNSQFSLTSGTVAGNLRAGDKSTITMSGGQANELFSSGQGTLTVSGGTVQAFAEASDNSTMTISGVTLTTAEALDSATLKVNNSTLTGVASANGLAALVKLDNVQANGGVSALGGTASVTGGTATTVSARQDGTLSASGVTISGNVTVQDAGTATVTNGSIAGTIAAQDTGTLTLSGVNVSSNQTITAKGSATITIGGGGSSILGSLLADGSSQINLSSGAVLGTLQAQSFGRATMSGGSVGGGIGGFGNGAIFVSQGLVSNNVTLFATSQFTLTGGTVSGSVLAQNSSSTIISGGQVQGNLHVFNSAGVILGGTGAITGETTLFGGTLQMTGGSIGSSLTGQATSTMLVNGGFVGGTVGTLNSSQATVGGSVNVAGFVQSHDTSKIFITGGTILGGVDAFQSSTIEISGGAIFGNIAAHDKSTVVVGGITLTGGGSPPSSGDEAIADSPGAATALPELFVSDSGTLEIDGHGLSAALLDPLNGNGTFSEYQISGRLADGSPIPDGLLMFVQNGSAASFRLVEAPVPEPAALALMGTAAVATLSRRRRA